MLLSLLITGCTCGSPETGDAGSDAGVDAATEPGPDAGLDAYEADAYGPDAYAPTDAFLTAPFCGPIVATACPVQSAPTVSGCASGEGLVFFDGAHCQQTPSLDCGPDRGAFTSFEECAVVCESAGHCDSAKISYHVGGMPGCDTPTDPFPACPGGVTVSTSLCANVG